MAYYRRRRLKKKSLSIHYNYFEGPGQAGYGREGRDTTETHDREPQPEPAPARVSELDALWRRWNENGAEFRWWSARGEWMTGPRVAADGEEVAEKRLENRNPPPHPKHPTRGTHTSSTDDNDNERRYCARRWLAMWRPATGEQIPDKRAFRAPGTARASPRLPPQSRSAQLAPSGPDATQSPPNWLLPRTRSASLSPSARIAEPEPTSSVSVSVAETTSSIPGVAVECSHIHPGCGGAFAPAFL